MRRHARSERAGFHRSESPGPARKYFPRRMTCAASRRRRVAGRCPMRVRLHPDASPLVPNRLFNSAGSRRARSPTVSIPTHLLGERFRPSEPPQPFDGQRGRGNARNSSNSTASNPSGFGHVAQNLRRHLRGAASPPSTTAPSTPSSSARPPSNVAAVGAGRADARCRSNRSKPRPARAVRTIGLKLSEHAARRPRDFHIGISIRPGTKTASGQSFRACPRSRHRRSARRICAPHWPAGVTTPRALRRRPRAPAGRAGRGCRALEPTRA